jgi:hypothetical protein
LLGEQKWGKIVFLIFLSLWYNKKI